MVVTTFSSIFSEMDVEELRNAHGFWGEFVGGDQTGM